MIVLKEIAKKDFLTNTNPLLFEEERANHCFAIVSDGNKSFKLAWRSTLIKPVIKRIQPNIYGIGIDQHFVIVDFLGGAILSFLNLFYPFYDIEIHDSNIFVITQLEIIQIKISDLKKKQEYALPDYFDSMEFINNTIRIKCINDEIETITIA